MSEKENITAITEEELHTNPLLGIAVNPNTELKTYLVEYVGTKLDQKEVTVNMISEVLALDFPEFTFAFAEENFLRGYQLGLEDAETLYTEQTKEIAKPTV